MAARFPNDIYQHSLFSAFKAGLTSSTGAPCGHLTGYGTHGLGIFPPSHPSSSNSSYNMLLHDSTAYVLSSSGRAMPAPRDAVVPFVMVTRFEPTFRYTVKSSQKLQKTSLYDEVFNRRADGRTGGNNSYMPFQVTGGFNTMQLVGEGDALKQVEGTVFGIAVPRWGKDISGEGSRCCFLGEEEEGGKRMGGEVVGFEVGEGATIEWAVCGHVHLGLPRGEEWEALDLP
ncbi:hypothetical protein B0A49_13145 [Cryomyces minteri]|uniref:Alpha-acetolactate decarboxylase n=1 Tax=Cryomyces minteri TaxID=331657 RepID=A0A4V5NDA0_9PEZI|nr:hypothetical protein B0A49_13145 [Cryomyces minteri]